MASSVDNALTRIPTIPTTRMQDVQKLVRTLQALLNGLPLARLLSLVKLCTFLLLLVNAGSFPFAWHLRVFWPVIVTRIRFLLLRVAILFKPPAERKRILAEHVEKLCPVGANPFELVTIYKRWASIDDADMFGMHLSNSSYAKALDSARLRIMWKAFPAWGVSRGVIALGATHYHFIREIPLFARYEVRISIVSWDSKWMYLIARYVTRPKGRRGTKISTTTSNRNALLHSQPPPDTNSNGDSSPYDTPTLIHQADGTASDNLEKTLGEALAATREATSTRRPILEPDGSVLHCIAVSQVCFKQGRISVPPALALACDGFSKPPPLPCGSDVGSHKVPPRYSPSNPPPHWPKVQEIRVPPTGSMVNFKRFLAGGWKEVPGADGSVEGTGDTAGIAGSGGRWWEEALSGPIEEKRRKNLEIVEALKANLEEVRKIY
ncbi:hypothetical protein ID866_5114 [Astraeus odoratus]|nr:hypothetical protein ID866_5114 [Astraeus odoratus]